MTLRILIILLCVSLSLHAQNIANYTIDVSLNPKAKTLSGKQQLVWTNTSPFPTKELQFHMYLNAFKDTETTFMKGSGGKLRNDELDTKSKKNFGYITISRLLVADQGDLTKNMRFIQPDNLNINDHTVLQVKLPKEVKPNETIEISIDFDAKMPKIFARTGWAANDYFFIGQWFPKLGVLEKDGKWNCHQFHANTEFYADFGKYKVNITIPQRFVVAATGSKTGELKLKNNLKSVTYEASNVHDFAWTASPHFVESTQTYKGIELKAFMQPEQSYLADRYYESVKNAIDYMEKHVGKYPHKTLSMIDPSLDGQGSGGMEYPTLITCGASWGVGRWGKYQEVVTIHEFAHQYFQGVLASNEFENSWMDEGFTQYMEGRIMDAYYKKGSLFNFFGFSVNDAASSRYDYVTMKNPGIGAIRSDAWTYPKGSYGTLTYTKPATVLRTLQNLIGEETMDEILKTYYNRFKFKHPTPDDFFNVANEIASKRTKYTNLNWFFEQTILEAKVCDYTVKNLKNTAGKGSFELRNLYDMKIPVDVLVTFEDGTTKTLAWDGENKNLSFEQEVRSVQIDPQMKNWMDLSLVNNSVSVEAPKGFAFKYAAKVLFWLQNIFMFA